MLVLGWTANHGAGQEMEEEQCRQFVQGVCCILDDSLLSNTKSPSPFTGIC